MPLSNKKNVCVYITLSLLRENYSRKNNLYCYRRFSYAHKYNKDKICIKNVLPFDLRCGGNFDLIPRLPRRLCNGPKL